MNRVQFGEGGCEKTRRYMDAYLSSELLVETNHEVLRHLEGCPACAAELETRARLRAALKSAVKSRPVPPALSVLVRERIRRQSAPWYAAALTGRGNWVLAAAAIFLCVGAFLNYPSYEPLPGIDNRPAQANYIQKVSASVVSIFKSGLSDHIHCAVFRRYPQNPPTVQEMEAMLGPEYQALLPLVEPVVPKGYRVVLAHQCSYAGRHYIHLTMRNGEDVISVVVTQKAPGETLAPLSPAADAHGVPIYQTSTDQYQLAAFESDRYLAFVVGLSRRRNLQIATALAPTLRRKLT